jgi:hypothetical protein
MSQLENSELYCKEFEDEQYQKYLNDM